MSRRTERPRPRFLITRVLEREHQLAHWYAVVVRQRPVADLLREASLTDLLTQAETALASGLFPVPAEFGVLAAASELRQSA